MLSDDEIAVGRLEVEPVAEHRHAAVADVDAARSTATR